MKRSERRRLRAIWLFIFIVGVSAASLLLVWPRYIAQRHRSLEERLETAMASLAQRRWERPPLGDDTRPGNAVEASIHAARGLSELPLASTPELAASLRAGELPPDLEPVLEAQAERLARLEQSVMRTFSRRAGSFEPSPEPTLRDRRAGIHLLLALALRDHPLGCAERVAVAVRIAQDASAGGGLEEASKAADEIDLALDVLPRCFETIGDEELHELIGGLERLASAFRMLAEHPVPIGDALEHAALAQAIGLARDTVPSDSPLDVLAVRTTLRRPSQLNQLEQILDVAARLARLDVIAYPALLTDSVALVESLPITSDADVGRRIDALLVLRRHGESVARLRAATIALRDFAVPGTGAPDWLMEAGLADPFDGAPMRFRVESDALVVWSVGHDGVDHHGSSELRAGEAPADVVFTMRTRREVAPEPERDPASLPMSAPLQAPPQAPLDDAAPPDPEPAAETDAAPTEEAAPGSAVPPDEAPEPEREEEGPQEAPPPEPAG
jgi:hypothetical protein